MSYKTTGFYLEEDIFNPQCIPFLAITLKFYYYENLFHAIAELLYKAPELLRTVSNFNTILIPGTQKGDIYSFAIILYEMHTR